MYPFTEQGIKQCLKETCNTESRLVPESFEFMRPEWRIGGMVANAEYEFATEDGNRYRLIAIGRDNFGDFLSRGKKYKYVKSIEKIE